MGADVLRMKICARFNGSNSIELLCKKSATSPSRKPMWQNPLRSFCHIGSADYIRRCCSSLRELRTSVNLQNPKNGSKLPSRDFANPPNRWVQPQNTTQQQTLPNKMPTLCKIKRAASRHASQCFYSTFNFAQRYP